MKAVIYTRVSSEEQVSNLSLDVQEKTCRDYCARNGWSVEAVYREEGESAKTANRTQLRRMLSDLRSHSVDFVVVYDTSRFARDVHVHTSLKQVLLKSGTQLRAATQPLEDTAAGRAIEGVFAVFNQLDNELRAEKITAGMKEAVSRGRWPWPPPLGFRHDRSPEGRKITVHDGERGILMRQGFEAVAAGDAPADVLERLTSLGLMSKKSRPVRYQEFRKFLRNPFYKGTVRADRWGIETQGLHEPLVDPVTWARVQQRLDGRYGHTIQPPRLKENPEFPLRGFVRCAVCGQPMTASNSRGKMGKTYPYYRCWIKGCGAAQARAERLEESFSHFLRRVELPRPPSAAGRGDAALSLARSARRIRAAGSRSQEADCRAGAPEAEARPRLRLRPGPGPSDLRSGAGHARRVPDLRPLGTRHCPEGRPRPGKDPRLCKAFTFKHFQPLANRPRSREAHTPAARFPRRSHLRRKGTWNPRNCLYFQYVRSKSDW